MSDPVARAIENLRREFPDLARLVLAQFEVNARAAVARRTFKVLHDEKRLSLLTLLADIDWGNNRRIAATLATQAVALAHVPRVKNVYARLTECERGTLLSTASEMALASFLIDRGAELSFDEPYFLDRSDGPLARDADIQARWPWGTVAFDVYSPVHQIENTRSGFLSLRPDGLAEQVSGKIKAKFGTSAADVRGLPEGALRILAVDLAYNETAFAGLHLPLGQVPEELTEVDLGGADGVMAFTHYQQIAGHPVRVHGFARPDERLDVLWRAVGTA